MTTIAPGSRVGGPSGRRLPGAIGKALGRVDRRLRVAGVMVGVGWALGMGAGVAAGVMAVDAVWPLPGGVRWGAWGVWAGGSGVVLLGALAGAVVRRPGREALAAVAERSGGLGERLSAAVALIGDGDRAHGSPELIEAVIAQASEEAGGIDPRRAVPLDRARRRMLAGVVAALVVASPGALGVEPFGTLGKRLVMPWEDPGTAGRLAITVEPGDVTIARGEALEVSAVVRDWLGMAGPGSARMEWSDGEGESHALEMGRGLAGEGSFAITVPRVDGAITYRIVAGSARSGEFRVSVVDPPRVVSHRWRVSAPSYMGIEPEEWESPSGVVAWEGSEVRIVAETDREALGVAIDWPGEESPVVMEPIDGSTRWEVGISATESGEFVMIPEGEDGIIDRLGPVGRLEVRPDAPPVVAAGESEGAARPDGEVLVPVAARDDLAVAGAELHYAVDRVDESSEGPVEGMVPITLEGFGTPEALGVASLDLTGLDLEHGDKVSVRIRVFDSRPEPEGPNEAWTGPRPVEVVDDVARFRAGEREEELRPVREALAELAKKVDEDRGRIDPLKIAADAERRDPSRWTEAQQAELEALTEAARERVEQLRELAEAIEENPELRELAESVREAAEADAEAARASLEDAGAPGDRAEDLRRAEEGLEGASEQIEGLAEQLEDLAKTMAARPELADLARQESELADRAEAMAGGPSAPDSPMPPADPEALGELQEAQERLAKALEEVRERAPGLGEAAQEAADEAEAASRELDRATEASDRGSSEAAKSAAEAMRRAAERLSEASGPADPSSRAERLAGRLAESGSGGESPASPSDREPDGPPSGSAEAGVADPSVEMGLRSDRAWGGLPGHLRTEMLRSSSGRYHPDYAALIRLYFQEIARSSSGGGQEGAGARPSP